MVASDITWRRCIAQYTGDGSSIIEAINLRPLKMSLRNFFEAASTPTQTRVCEPVLTCRSKETCGL